MGAVAECKQSGGGVLSTDDNFAKEGKEVRLVEMNDDVVAPSARASSDVNSFLKKEKQTNEKHCYLQNQSISVERPTDLLLFSVY